MYLVVILPSYHILNVVLTPCSWHVRVLLFVVTVFVRAVDSPLSAGRGGHLTGSPQGGPPVDRYNANSPYRGLV